MFETPRMIKSSQNVTVDKELFLTLGNMSKEVVAHSIKDEVAELIAEGLKEADRSMRTLAPEIDAIRNRIDSVIYKLNNTNGYQLFPGPSKYASLIPPLAMLGLMLSIVSCVICHYKCSRKGHQSKPEVPVAASKHYKVISEPYEIECVETV